MAENKDHMMPAGEKKKIKKAARQLPSVQFPTDCLALNFRFSFTARSRAAARKEKRKRGRDDKRTLSVLY